MCRLSVRNAFDPSKEMVDRPVIGFFVHSVHSTFMLSRSCRWRFAIAVISVAGSGLVTPFCYPIRSVVPFYVHVTWDSRYFYTCPYVLIKKGCRFYELL